MSVRYRRCEAADAVRRQRGRTLALFESIESAAWEQSVSPGWRVREVAAHLISTDEASLTGRLFRLGFSPVPVERLEAWNDEQVRRWADRPIPSLLHALDVWGRRLVRVLSRTPARVAEATVPTPFGKVTPAWLAMMRVYDEWIHDEDVREALGLPPNDAPDVIRPVAVHLFEVVPIQTLPRVPAAATGRLTFVCRDLDVTPFGVDLDSRRYGVAVGEAPTVVTYDARAFIMVAAGRRAWRDAEAAGEISIAGPRDAAETFLDVLIAV